MTNTSRRITGEQMLPLQMTPFRTPFIDRQEELAGIAQLLANPSCRLLTLIGPGGIGKTRMAWELTAHPGVPKVGYPQRVPPAGRSNLADPGAAAGHDVDGWQGPQFSDLFADGVHFVNLASVRTKDLLVPALADTLGCVLNGSLSLLEQVCNYLKEKKLLLILDNFEHLLSLLAGEEDAHIDSAAEVAGWLAEMLRTAAGLKLLITSREALNLQEEWLYPVGGLATPPVSQASVTEDSLEDDSGGSTRPDFEAYGAVRLFVAGAQRIRPNFNVTEEMAGIVRICQLVEGMPLALELAAAWTQTLDCETIAGEIQRNLNFLTTSLRNAPDRHRSVQAVFAQTWSMLNEEERRVFQRLAVFRGGFRRSAAEYVAGATLPVLSSLVSKSLLRWEANGRYQIHELLRQYAEEQLNSASDQAEALYNRHCSYFTEFLHQRSGAVIATQQHEALDEISEELENIRSAWAHAIRQTDVAALHKATHAYTFFCDMRGRYQEVAEALEQAIRCLERAAPSQQTQEALAAVMTSQGWNYIRLGRLQEADALFNASLKIFQMLGVSPPAAFASDPVIGLSLLAQIAGDYARARALATAVCQRYETDNDRSNMQIGLFILANAAFSQGNYEAAWEHAQQAYHLTKTLGNRWMMAYILGDLGNVARALGKYDHARQYFHTCYTVKKEFNDPEGMAMALNNLAKIARLQQDYTEAERLLLRSLALYQRINDRGGLATSYYELGENALARCDFNGAREHLLRALQITTKIAFHPLTLAILTAIAELLRQWGQSSSAVELLALSDEHAAAAQETKDIARARLACLAEEMAPDLFQAALEDGRARALDIVCEMMLATLGEAAPVAGRTQGGAPGRAAQLTGAPSEQPLVESLTNREFEVLQLIGGGLTNQEIADMLILSVGTVKFYTGQIYGKLGVRSRTQALVRARELALLEAA